MRIRIRLAAAAGALGAVALTAGPAVAAAPHHHKRHHAKKSTTSRTVIRPAEAPAPAPAPAPAAPAVTSVISIGGYVFYNVSYTDAVNAYNAAVAAGTPPQAPAGTNSVSVTTTVGGVAG